jgi:hypothetical protein
MSVELDHVLVAVSDLAESARELEVRYGLASIEGGCHPGWGTANRIVPLGDAYLELVTVVDEEEALASVLRRLGRRGASGGRPASRLGRSHPKARRRRRATRARSVFGLARHA